MKGSKLPESRRAWRRWLDSYNPLRGLNLRRVVGLLEAAQRGEMAEYQWTLRTVERRFPVLGATMARRRAALMEMDWAIKEVDSDVLSLRGGTAAQARRQARVLRTAYEGIGNVYDAVGHLGEAVFKGYALAEKIYAGGRLTELRAVEPWNLVRDGIRNAWKYNPEAQTKTFDGMTEEELPLERFLWRTQERPVGEQALVAFLRHNLAQKSWDAFLEIYGVPGGVVIGPPDMPEDKAAAFEKAALELSEGGSGYLPNGSLYVSNDSPRGVNPFLDHLKRVDEMLVLAATGGKLTMLNDATGIGGSQGDVHADAFHSIASADAREINECFQRQVDAEVLGREFPGQPVLAYFELNFREETDAGELSTMLVQLSQAGLSADAEEIGEKLGLKLEQKDAGTGGLGDAGKKDAETGGLGDAETNPKSAIQNPQSAELANRRLANVADGLGVPVGWLSPVMDLMADMEAKLADDSVSDADVREFLQASQDRLPELLGEMDVTALAEAMEPILGEAVLAGLREEEPHAKAAKVAKGKVKK